MRLFVLILVLSVTAWGQSFGESGAMLAGSVAGSAAGKKLSDSMKGSLKRTATTLEKAAKSTGGAAKAPAPSLQVGATVTKAELNNVPPPPPPRRAATRPAPRRAVSAPIVFSAPRVEAPPQPPVNVDLGQISNGMTRAGLLALGQPSVKMTTSEDGHLIEIFQYRNQSLTSGTVRLRDGAVYSIEARP